MSRNSNRSPPQGHGRSNATLNLEAGLSRRARSLGASAGRPPSWCDQGALFVEPQSLDGNTQPRGGLGSTQELRGGAHESPRHWLTAILIEAAPRGGSSTYSPTPAISPVIKL